MGFTLHIKLVLLDIGQAFVRGLLVLETICLGAIRSGRASGPCGVCLTGRNPRKLVRPPYRKASPRESNRVNKDERPTPGKPSRSASRGQSFISSFRAASRQDPSFAAAASLSACLKSKFLAFDLSLALAPCIRRSALGD